MHPYPKMSEQNRETSRGVDIEVEVVDVDDDG